MMYVALGAVAYFAALKVVAYVNRNKWIRIKSLV